MKPHLIVALVLGFAALVAAGSARAYNPVIDPADFVSRIDNRYLPLRPGTVFVYEGESDGELERNTVRVTRLTKSILGVRCVVVRDYVSIDGEPAELTFDWYAQDRAGNVWYFGEDSRDFVNGRWVRSDGSWEAGVDGARPGIVMLADPRARDTYRQEFYPGHAEDKARVLGTVRWLSVPYGSFDRVLLTREWTPLQPGVVEWKYYAPGVGLVKTLQVKGGSDESQLVSLLHR
jgi:hypothetical protein